MLTMLLADLEFNFSWITVASVWRKISETKYSFVPSTVGIYCAAMNSLGYIPEVGDEIIEAVQFHL